MPPPALRLAACALVLGALGLAPAGYAAMAPAPLRAPAPAAQPPAALAPWVHAYAAFGSPKYPPGFDHFGYVNPAAPKTGTLYLRNPDRRSSFDKFNPFTTRGNSPAGVMLFMMEPLAILSGDEPQTMYGLLAEAIQVAPDKSSIAFRLNPKAHFYNGDPVTAADVKYSFDSMSGKYAYPIYQTAFAGVEKCVVVDERTVRFDLKDRTTDTLFTLGNVLRIFSRKWGLGPDGKPKRFDDIVSEYPITTGPYTIDVTASGRRIEFKRNPDYWGRDLAARRGFFNFERVVYRYYQDAAVSREAFKAGEFDLYKEYGVRSWVRQHKGPKWDDGRIRKDPFETAVGQGLQSYQLNLRRPKFQDIRVREALDYTYDFDTLNRYGLFKRANSLFNNSDFAAEGLPSPGELKLLEPFRQQLPAEVFGPAFRAPRTHGRPEELRANLLKARSLLEQAGWKLAPDGKLRNAQGEAFEIEYLSPSEGARMPDWELNLAKLGITLKIRSVDFALYRRRLETFDFDMITIVEGDFTFPAPADLSTSYLSKTADEQGSNNFRGVKSPAADAALAAMSAAKTIDELRDAARALDRIVMWNHWQVPDLYVAAEWASYWNRFGIPATRPKYFTLESSLTEMPAWAVTAWWQLAPRK